jgi:proteasome lid subunit RPN8/RPN11
MVTEAIRAENEEKRNPAQQYVLGHEAHLKVVEMEASGQYRIAGYYHSHPEGGIRPSSLDAELAVAGVNYLIIGLKKGRFSHALWRLEGAELTYQALEVE